MVFDMHRWYGKVIFLIKDLNGHSHGDIHMAYEHIHLVPKRSFTLKTYYLVFKVAFKGY